MTLSDGIGRGLALKSVFLLSYL